MGKSVIRTGALALALALLPSLAVAAGLGKLTVLSGLGQPLKAEIELLALQKGEADNLSVRLPPANVFRTANIDYSAALLSIKFKIERRGEDRYVVVLNSAQPMNEPFLDMLVELDWNTGRLVREYTFLLDPPEYKGPAAPMIAAPVAGSPEVRSVEMPKQPPSEARMPVAERPLAPAAPAGAAAAPAAPSAAAPKAQATYTVKRGDTLTKIANANRPDSVSLQQMLIALYRSNADVFDGNNINRMRAGKILNIPDADAAASIDQDEATRMVSSQAADFNEYRRKLGAAVAAAPERPVERRQSASGKITARVEDKPMAAKGAQDQLKLSKAEEAGKPGAGRSIQGLQEDLIAKEKAIKEANERIALLQKNVQDMQKLLEIKSQSAAQLQQQAAKASAAPATMPAKAPETAKAPEPAKPAETAKAPEPPKAVESAKLAEGVKEPPKAASPKPAPKKVVAPPPPPPEPSLIDEILGNELALYGGGGFLVLLFVGYGYYAWRRKKSLQIIETSSMAAPSLAADSVFGAVGAAGDAAVDTGFGGIQADAIQGSAAASIDTEEVDPIAEADVYMAYGRDVQAEEILREALAKDPSRQAIRVKLLEIYANRKDAKAFEAVAAEIQSATGGTGADWERAVLLGTQLDPGNPLYGGSATEAEGRPVTDTQEIAAGGTAPDIVLEMGGEPEPSPGLDFDLGLSGSAPEGASGPESAPVTDVTGDLGFDLDLGGDDKPAAAVPKEQRAVSADASAPQLPEAVAEAPADAVSSIDFDFELPSSDAAAEPASAASAPELPAVAQETLAAPAESSGGIDFDFNFDLPEQKAEAQPESAPLDLSAISLDLGAPGEAPLAPDAHWQEVATKLDLAKAYQDMGDKDGARELLNEVVKEGDAAQQEQAQTMLAALG